MGSLPLHLNAEPVQGFLVDVRCQNFETVFRSWTWGGLNTLMVTIVNDLEYWSSSYSKGVTSTT